jgi:hypothetical protein
MSARRKSALLLTGALIALAALLVALVLFRSGEKNAPADSTGARSSERSSATASDGDASTSADASPNASARQNTNTPEISRLIARIESALAAFQRGGASDAVLDELRDEFRRARPQDAIAAILQFLGSGRDAGTGAAFEVGEGGALEGSPTLRIFLMDQLGQLTRGTGSAEAAQIARTVLETKNSADEWAISLRNVAWSEQNSAQFLASKLHEMLDYQPWREKPSTGFLEAFDVAVYTKDPGFVGSFAELVRGQNTTLQQAAGVALDRLAETAPLEVMRYFNTHPDALADRPLLRADYFAKADVSNPAQKQALETYLLRGDVSTAEKSKLFRSIAEPGTFVSDNLLTTPMPPSSSENENSARNQALDKAAEEWLASSRFPELKPQIEQLRVQLQITQP